MSSRQIRVVVRDLFEDAAVGLAAEVRALRDLTESGPAVRDDFGFGWYAPRLEAVPSTAPYVAVTTGEGADEIMQGPMQDYDSDTEVVCTVQWWGSDPAVLQDTWDTYRNACRRVVSRLRAFSDGHDEGTVVNLRERIRFSPFADPGAVSEGFTCSFQVMERSAE